VGANCHLVKYVKVLVLVLSSFLMLQSDGSRRKPASWEASNRWTAFAKQLLGERGHKEKL